MDTKIFETFLLVAESGGLTSAASILGVPQSQVSRHMKELEAECRASLLYRHGRGVKLTSAGERLRDSLGPLVAQLQDALVSASSESRKVAGVVHLGLTPTFIRLFGLKLLDAMAQEYPAVQVRMVSGNSRYVYEWTLHAQVDIGVLSDAAMSSQLLLDEVGTSRVVLVASPAFPLPKAGPIPPDLAGIPLRLSSRVHGVRRLVDQWAAQHGISLTVAFEVDDLDVAKEILLTGRAASIMSRLSVARELADGTLVERSLGDDLTARTVLATARNRPVTPAMKATINTLKSISAPFFLSLPQSLTRTDASSPCRQLQK